MSSPSELEQQQLCPRFSEGRWCFQQKKCGLVHDSSIYKAAKKEKKSAKPNSSAGGSPLNFCVQRDKDVQAAMSQGENKPLEDSQNGSLVQSKAAELVQKFSIAGKKHQQPVEDTQSSKYGRSRSKKGGKKVSENVDPVRKADHTPKTVKDPNAFKLNNPSPNMSSGPHGDEQRTESKLLHSIPLRQKLNHGISRNTAALSTSTQRTNPRWPKATNHRDSHANTPGARTAEEVKDPNTCFDLARQVGEVRSARMRYYGRIGQKPSLYEVTDSKPLKWFTLFRELPFEIRLIIWHIAICFAYNPTVRLQPIRDDNHAIIFHYIICQSLTPIVLRINRESRTEALKHYSLSLGESTYINKSTGTVFLDSNEPGELTQFVASVPHQELQTIENLAIRLSEWSWMDETFKEAMWQFTNIKRLAMIFSKSDDSFYLTKSAYRLISKELKKPKESRDDWQVPIICLVPSDMVEGFLKSNTFT